MFNTKVDGSELKDEHVGFIVYLATSLEEMQSSRNVIVNSTVGLYSSYSAMEVSCLEARTPLEAEILVGQSVAPYEFANLGREAE